MLRLLADENLQNAIVQGVRRHHPEIDFTTVQEAGLRGYRDPDLLEWAARHDRLLVTHDANTIPAFAYERVRAGREMPGVVLLSRSVPIRSAIEDLALLVTTSSPEEWEGQVIHLPL